MTSLRTARRAARPAALLLVIAAVAAQAACGAAPHTAVTVLTAERAVDFDAEVHAAAWSGEMAGYHLIVWRDGGSADAALFRAAASDVEVLDALESLGAKPGNALDVGSWDQRDDPQSWKPDQVIQGPPVELLVRPRPDAEWLRLDQIVDDPARGGFDLRFGGHRANIPAWKSGCVVCLYSCPGGKIGNARYTVRDFTKKTTRFAVKDGVLPPDGAHVTIRVRLLDPS